jgi:uncharacterized protein YdaU (DUF1376 family)
MGKLSKRVTLKDVQRVDFAFGEYIKEFGRHPGWSIVDIGCLMTLDIYLYDSQGTLADDVKTLAVLCRMSESDFAKSWQRIAHLFKSKNDVIFRKRIDMELKAARKRIQTSVNNGLKGGRPRKPTGLPQDSDRKGITNTNTNTNELVLELNKRALVFDDKVTRLFGPLLPNERVTFSKIRIFLISFSSLEKMEAAIGWISECKRWGADHKKDSVEVKKCFVSKVKKILGWQPGK